MSEILDSELLGEGLIPTLQHAHDVLLVEHPLTVPYRATIYGQLVESTYLWKLHDLYNHEAAALDGIHLVPSGNDDILRVKRQQHPMHADAMTNEIKLNFRIRLLEAAGESWRNCSLHKGNSVRPSPCPGFMVDSSA